MENYAALISIIIMVAAISTFVATESASLFSEAIIPENITGLSATSDDGQPYIEYLDIPLKLLHKNATNNSTSENTSNNNFSEADLPCSIKNEERGYENCLLFNVYTTVNISNANDSLPRLPVKFYILQMNKQYPKYNPSLGQILVTVKDIIAEKDMDLLRKESVITQISLEWMYSAIERFGGNPANIRSVEDAPHLEVPHFAIGYELPQSNYKTPIRLSESKKFIQRNENSIELVEETTLQDKDNNEVTTMSP